jgi:small subunit ribosomal protein S18
MPRRATTLKTKGRRPGGGRTRRIFRPKSCKFCSDQVTLIDFRDTARLAKFTSERGKITPRRISGTCAAHQRQLSRAIKHARTVALMPYIAAGV